MKRGVGYCENTDCEDYAKGVFLLNHGDTFYCPRCRQLGKVEKERGFYTGNSDIFKEVRVEYNFDPINGVYREIAIVRDESLWGRNNVYTLQSPLIKTEKRALKVAEAILANLNRYRGLLNGDDIPRTTEIILSFDDPFEEFSRKLQQLSPEDFQAAANSRPLRKHFYRRMGQDGFSSEEIDKAIDDIRSTVDRMETALDGAGPWLMGEQYTLADICVVPSIDRMEDLGYEELWEKNHPHVTAWFRRIMARSAVQTAFYKGARFSDIYPELGLGRSSPLPA